MNNKHIILHVGLDKAGSTAIQRSCFLLNDVLHKKGYNWVHNNVTSHRGIYRGYLAGDLQKLKDASKEIAQSHCQTHIISCEGFYHLRGKDIEDFLRYFDMGSIRIVFYLRERGDKIRSGLAQRLKFQDRVGFDLLKRIYGRSSSDTPFGAPDYNALVSRWEKAAARMANAKVALSLYDREAMIKGDIVIDFFVRHLRFSESEAIDLAAVAKRLDKKKEYNPSLSPAAQDVMALTAMLTVDKRKRKLVREILYANDLKEETRHSRVSDQDINDYCAKFRDSDRLLAQRFFNRDELFLSSSNFTHCEASATSFHALAQAVLSESEQFKLLSQNNELFNEAAPTLHQAADKLESDSPDLAIKLRRLATKVSSAILS